MREGGSEGGREGGREEQKEERHISQYIVNHTHSFLSPLSSCDELLLRVGIVQDIQTHQAVTHLHST